MKIENGGMLQVKELLVRASLGLLLLFWGVSARAQDVRTNCSQVSACTLTPAGGLPWSQANQIWIFRPLNPRVSVYIFIRNQNPTSSHISQTVTVWQSPFGIDLAPSLSANSSRWTQDTLVQNTTTNASCNALAAANDASPGASGLGSCFVTTMFAAQVAIRITGAATASGSPDNFDLAIVQETGTPGGQSPGASAAGFQLVSGPLQPLKILTVAEQTSATNGTNVFSMLSSPASGRAYLFSIAVRATSGTPVCGITVNDSTVGGNVWSSDANFVSTSTRTITWPVPLTSNGPGGVMTVTVSACGAGITSVLDVQASTL